MVAFHELVILFAVYCHPTVQPLTAAEPELVILMLAVKPVPHWFSIIYSQLAKTGYAIAEKISNADAAKRFKTAFIFNVFICFSLHLNTCRQV